MFAPYCSQANDVQGRCRFQNEPVFLSSRQRYPPPPHMGYSLLQQQALRAGDPGTPMLIPISRYNIALPGPPCMTPHSLMRQMGYI